MVPWSKGAGKGERWPPQPSAPSGGARGPWWLPDQAQRAQAAIAAKAEPEKRGIPNFRARHERMKAEWGEKWSAEKETWEEGWGDEDWGDEDWGEEDWGEEDWGEEDWEEW